MSGRSVVQLTVLVMSVLVIAHDVVALAVNPDFGIGDDAKTEEFLWVDYNGWHAVAGFFLFGPGLWAWRHADWARLYALSVVVALLSTAIWGLLDEHPLGVLSLPDQRADAIFHVGVAAAYVIALMAEQLRGTLRRPEPRAL